MALYIGTNYHPHDWEEERWKTDIELMKQAGFTTVRLGHLCWDSYEPEEGVYTFEWFDRVMDLFAEANIGVLLDVSMRPAPVWVHKLCPGCNIAGKSGNMQASLRRYMEDVADPAYQYYALRFARVLAERYKNHPALTAFGLCNEIGDGYISYSEYARERFSQWLKKKYGTIEVLNEAWAARRWSRKLNSFDDVALPENEVEIGAPEAWLDMKRFWSDGIADFMIRLKETVEDAAPGIPHSSNHYAEKDRLGFDYLKYYQDFVDYPGMGMYSGYSVGRSYYFNHAIYMQRLAETGKPMWCLEFQTGSKGIPWGPEGAVRMHVLLSLLNRAQMVLGWTWRSMLGGEEQYLCGMLGHDGIPTPIYYEYKRIAQDMKKLEKYAFPYLPQPDTAIAYNYDSCWVNAYSPFQYRQAYRDGYQEATRVFYEKNMDHNVVDLRNLKGEYKLLIVPGHIVMDSAAAQTIRAYVENGGTVVMTGYSAAVDETGKVYSSIHPGGLDDVFGIRVVGFYRTDMEWLFDENSVLVENGSRRHELLRVEAEDGNFVTDCDYYEILECRNAVPAAMFADKNLPAVTVNRFGKGAAYYVASEPDYEMLSWLVEKLTDKLNLKRGVTVPEGIQVRKIADDQIFYVNTTSAEIRVPLTETGYGVLSEKYWEKELGLKAYDGELIVQRNRV